MAKKKDKQNRIWLYFLIGILLVVFFKYFGGSTLLSPKTEAVVDEELIENNNQQVQQQTSPQAVTCTETDGGANFLVVGSCTDSQGKVDDGCSTQKQMLEWYCENNECKSTVMGCSLVESCIEGACTPTPIEDVNCDVACQAYAPQGFAHYSDKTEGECILISSMWTYINNGGCCCQTELSRCKESTCANLGFDYAGLQVKNGGWNMCANAADNYCYSNQISQDAGGAHIEPLVGSTNKECCCWNC